MAKTQVMQVPPWINAKECRRYFGLNEKRMKALLENGTVRSHKEPGGSRSVRTYKSQDIIDYLEGNAQ